MWWKSIFSRYFILCSIKWFTLSAVFFWNLQALILYNVSKLRSPFSHTVELNGLYTEQGRTRRKIYEALFLTPVYVRVCLEAQLSAYNWSKASNHSHLKATMFNWKNNTLSCLFKHHHLQIAGGIVFAKILFNLESWRAKKKHHDLIDK